MTPTSWALYTIIAMVGWKSQLGLLDNLALIQQYVWPLIHLHFELFPFERSLAIAF